MTFLELVLLSVALGADLFSLAIPLGLKPVRWPKIVEASFVFAFFHILFMLLGCSFGLATGRLIEAWSSEKLAALWLIGNWAQGFGALVLLGLGIRMLGESFHTKPLTRTNPLTGWTLPILAMTVSIDALAAGLALGMLEVPWLTLCAVLGCTIFLIAFVGLSLGRFLGYYWGLWAERSGGLVLTFLGTHFLIQALF